LSAHSAIRQAFEARSTVVRRAKSTWEGKNGTDFIGTATPVCGNSQQLGSLAFHGHLQRQPFGPFRILYAVIKFFHCANPWVAGCVRRKTMSRHPTKEWLTTLTVEWFP